VELVEFKGEGLLLLGGVEGLDGLAEGGESGVEGLVGCLALAGGEVLTEGGGFVVGDVFAEMTCGARPRRVRMRA
jgi:hypothetical protein